ncbi:biotin transporter BioY [bacterium]|nr:biotin transporter BioY [bacterium]
MKTQDNALTAKLNITFLSKNNIVLKLIFALVFTLAMAASANVSIYTPVSPVPITLQTMTVLLSGIFLGSKFALISQIGYLMIGTAGFSVFAGFKSGAAALSGATGGYLLGFVFAAYITGYIFENFENIIKEKIYLTLIACLTGLSVIYFLGYIHLFGLLSSVYHGIALKILAVKAFDMAVKPFILIEFMKFFMVIDSAVIWKINIRKNIAKKS